MGITPVWISHQAANCVAIAGTYEVMSSEINLTGRMLASRPGKGGRERAGTNLQADHGEKQAVLVQEVKHLRGTQVSGARAGAVAMGRRRLTAG